MPPHSTSARQLSLVCTDVQAHQSVQFFAVQLSDMAGVWMDSVFLQDILPYELPPLGEFEVDNEEKESLRLLHFKVNWWTVIDWLEFHCKGSVLHFVIYWDHEHIEHLVRCNVCLTPSDRRFLMVSPQ